MHFENIEQHAVIMFLYEEGRTLKEIYERLFGVYSPHVFCYSLVANWFKQIKFGRESIVDEPWCGKPSNDITINKITAVENMI